MREATGYAVAVGDVLWVRDYIGASHAFAAYEPDVHQIEVMFACWVDRSQSPPSLSKKTPGKFRSIGSPWMIWPKCGSSRPPWSNTWSPCSAMEQAARGTSAT